MRRRAAFIGVAAVMALTLGGCGFRPVYATAPRGGLPRIDVELIPERSGQLMRQALQAKLPSPGQAAARYGLAVQFGIASDAIGIISDSTGTRLRYLGSATYALTDRDTGLVVQRGAARALDGIDVVDQQLLAVDLAAERVRVRLAEGIADQIVTQIAARLRG